jgi:hypothetical protein
LARKELQNVEEPNLFEEIFPHVEVPRIRFTGKIYEEIVEFDPTLVLKRRIWISDTTSEMVSRPDHPIL